MSRILERDAVLVRGWLGEADACLEPVIPLATAPASAGEAAGPYRLRGFADNDEALFDVRLGEAGLVAVAGQAQRQFAAAVLLNPGGAQALARVVLEAGETSVTRRAVRTAAELRAALAGVQISTLPDGRTGVRWDADQFALLQLSDPATGSVLALDRDGEVTVTAPHGALEVALSDGVRSAAALFALR
ncbi:hypothetical protein [Thioalkalivibrio sp. XN279]|uniref:hypothetical protein n=1 Tax=Thioalkalivibrio sp. XN279 TaxID=2714953 RepID=UPI00140E5981|nr:hypothetical protein [Thioalkalivibrio sp. XN279]NHA15879.1 hypothetical protein [Thioalkalivibrio sp. XN279]